MQEKWNDHHELVGLHSYLSPSQHAWLNYDAKKNIERYVNKNSQEIGTIIHALAEKCIKNRIVLSENDTNLIEMELRCNYINPRSYDSAKILKTLMPFVNDSIGYGMSSEVVLRVDKDAFGTSDAIRADIERRELRIFDLKTGVKACDEKQLLVYAAYYCLEYGHEPDEFEIRDLRIYQDGEAHMYNPTPEQIKRVMLIVQDKIAEISTVR